MKQKYRYGVFETNSSSCHSLVYKNQRLGKCRLKLDEYGKIHASYGSYDGPYTIEGQRDKLNYIVTHSAFMDNYDKRELLENLNEALTGYVDGCSGLTIDGDSSDADLNHQLMNSLSEILNFYNPDEILHFIFNDNVTVSIWHD